MHMSNSKSIESLIDRYESQIEELESKIYKLEKKLERAEFWADGVAWDRPRRVDLADVEHLASLPVPRLQIELTIKSESCHSWFYSLVYLHTTGDIDKSLEFIPMGQTKSNGGHKYSRYDSLDERMKSLPFRDGVHIRRDAAQLNLPAYAIAEGYIWQLPPIEKA
jgi:hypothetical protein